MSKNDKKPKDLEETNEEIKEEKVKKEEPKSSGSMYG